MSGMEGILGQSHAIQLLESALVRQRLHHGYILHGPPGVGKFTTAQAFARMLLCLDPTGQVDGAPRACGRCRACGLASTGNHPDEHVIRKELARYSDDARVRQQKLLNIPVAVLREHLLEPVALAPRIGRHKVFIVDEAELLQDIAQNLLLKTLEEPPPGTFILLVTASEDRLLPTIRSRCHRVPFVPLSDRIIAAHLDQHTELLDTEQRAWLIDFAAGSLGVAYLALRFELFTWATTVLPAIDAMTEGRFPSELGGQMKEMVEAFAKRWVDENKAASKDAANKQAVRLLWSIIGQHARTKLRARANAPDAHQPDAAEFQLEPWLATVNTLAVCQQQIDSNVNLGVVMDHAVSLMYRALANRESILLGV